MAVVVAYLVERWLPVPEVRGSNPDIGVLYITYKLSTEKTKVIKLTSEMARFYKKDSMHASETSSLTGLLQNLNFLVKLVMTIGQIICFALSNGPKITGLKCGHCCRYG